MKRPIIILLISYLLGIATQEFIKIDLVLIFFLVLLLTLIYKKSPKKAIICIVCLGLGFVYTYLSYPKIKEEKTNLIGQVYKIKEYDSSNLYFLNNTSLKGPNTNLIFYSDQDFDLGDWLKIDGELERINGDDNFKAYNKEKYYKSLKIFYQVDSDDIELIKKDPGLREKIRESTESYLDQNLNDQAASFLKSMILASDNQDPLVDSYRNLGLAHILAISGLHLNIIISLIDSFAINLGLEKRKFGIVLIILLLAYGYLVYFQVSIIRAISMYALSYLTIYSLSIKDKINDLLVTMFICLIINPFYIYSVSFYLSFAAIYAIVYIGPNLKRILKKWPDFITGSLAIQIGTFPFVIHYFNSINLLTILANLITILILSFVLSLSFIFIIFRLSFLSYFIDGAFIFLDFLITSMDQFGVSFKLSFPSLSVLTIIFYYLAIYIIFNYRMIAYKFKKKKILMLSLILPSLILIKSLIPIAYINFIDVGQGDAILYRDGKYNILFDTGGKPFNLEASGKSLYNYLTKNGVSQLDGVFISHPDTDHMGNLYYLVDHMPIGSIKGNPMKDFKMEKVSRGQVYKYGNLSFEVILDGKDGINPNDSSIVLLGQIFSYKILLTGDIEDRDRDLNIDGHIDFLKVSHHGARDSTSQVFIDQNSFSNAFISAGYNNRYGHPHKETIEKLEENNIEIYRTDFQGNIEIILRPYGYFIHTYKDKKTLGDIIIKILLY